jgi:lipopolysaccharide cholinephosphotransferase
MRARSMLLEVVKLLDFKNIKYHLEGGTLLGIVRDGDLLPWDHDVDISIPYSEAHKFLKIKKILFFRGYKVSIRKSTKSVGPFKKGHYTLFKVKRFVPSIIKWALPWYSKQYIVLDLFVKPNDENHTYWQAQGKLLRVENKFYNDYDSVDYIGYKFKIPNLHKEYLSKKYGDWSTPVKQWECRLNEGTIFHSI